METSNGKPKLPLPFLPPSESSLSSSSSSFLSHSLTLLFLPDATFSLVLLLATTRTAAAAPLGGRTLDDTGEQPFTEAGAYLHMVS